MKTHLSNLATVYATATGEIPRNEKELKRLLPTVWSIDQFGYLLNAYARDPWRETMEDGELALLLLALERMAQSADWGHPLPMPELPALAGQPRLREEIASLGQSLDGSLEREGEPATS
ncbi:hypothetical protein [Cohnella zeiphila]|uniref:Uncharacterized protein n=1 Tax=Cohnella zeiphila TaxID=2761120 RepID=A0A7X0SQF2_9BACL|nr:hypothetical protein [Cohnella zeiphila]MBB6734233.1 hypothetical protein [Cohnella zeiphila]